MRTADEVERLIAAGTTESVLEAFRWGLHHPAYEESPAVRALHRRAVEALATLDDPAALDVLIPMLGDVTGHELPPRRVDLVVAALGSLGDRRALGSLLTCLDAPHGYIREAAATALGELGDPSAIPALEHVRDTDSWGVESDDETHTEYPVHDAAVEAIRKLRAASG